MKEKVFLGLGSNIGDRRKNLVNALNLLSKNGSICIEKVSSLYETAPVGFFEQDTFYNIAVLLETELNPFELLKVTSDIEKEMGRERLIHWGPRNIDIDILYYSEEKIETEDLIIPHPRIGERAFVLVPLFEVDNNLKFNGEKLDFWLKKLENSGELLNQTINNLGELKNG